jgi:hypothetical protein
MVVNSRRNKDNIFPKLLGSYEKELHNFFYNISQKNYTNIINIGCDDGYYLIGIALKLKGVDYYGFDINDRALRECKQLIAANRISEKIYLFNNFTHQKISHLAVQKNLFIVDCEGAEYDLIDSTLVKNFSTSDFIIELHFVPHPDILEQLQERFEHTHMISVVKAIADAEKVTTYAYTELANLSFLQKYFILNERADYTEWLIAEAKVF